MFCCQVLTFVPPSTESKCCCILCPSPWEQIVKMFGLFAEAKNLPKLKNAHVQKSMLRSSLWATRATTNVLIFEQPKHPHMFVHVCFRTTLSNCWLYTWKAKQEFVLLIFGMQRFHKFSAPSWNLKRPQNQGTLTVGEKKHTISIIITPINRRLLTRDWIFRSNLPLHIRSATGTRQETVSASQNLKIMCKWYLRQGFSINAQRLWQKEEAVATSLARYRNDKQEKLGFGRQGTGCRIAFTAVSKSTDIFNPCLHTQIFNHMDADYWNHKITLGPRSVSGQEFRLSSLNATLIVALRMAPNSGFEVWIWPPGTPESQEFSSEWFLWHPLYVFPRCAAQGPSIGAIRRFKALSGQEFRLSILNPPFIVPLRMAPNSDFEVWIWSPGTPESRNRILRMTFVATSLYIS